MALTSRWRSIGLPLLISRLLGQGAELMAIVVLARRLAPGAFGRLAVAFLVCRYLGLVADWGASIGGVRHVAAQRSAETVHALVRRRYLVTAILSAAYLAATLALGYRTLAPLVFAIAGRGLSRDWLALGQERGSRSGTPAVVQGTVTLVGSLLVTREEVAALPIAAGYALAAVVSVVLNRLPSAQRRARVRVDAWVLVIVLADQVTASTDTVMLAALRSAREAGIYAAVYRIPNAWITVVGLIVLGLIPAVTRNLRDRPEELASLRDSALHTGLMWGGVVLLSVPPAYVLVPVVFGEPYRSGQLPLIILLIATAVNAAAAPLHPIYFALARDRALASMVAGVAILNLASNFLVIPRWGMTGAATTTLAAQVVLFESYRRGVARAVASGTP